MSKGDVTQQSFEFLSSTFRRGQLSITDTDQNDPIETVGTRILLGPCYFFENFSCNLTIYESEIFLDTSPHHILESKKSLGDHFLRKIL